MFDINCAIEFPGILISYRMSHTSRKSCISSEPAGISAYTYSCDGLFEAPFKFSTCPFIVALPPHHFAVLAVAAVFVVAGGAAGPPPPAPQVLG